MEQSTLFNSLSKKDIEVYLTNRQYETFFWSNFLDFKRKLTFTIETLIGTEGNHVAADIVAYDSSAPEKKRPATNRQITEAVAIRVKRRMTETDLNEYFQLMNLADSTSKRDAIQLVFNDIDFVVNSVMARLEWMTFQMLSYGSLTLTTTNNAGVVTPVAVDYGLPSTNKEYIGSAGGTGAATHYWTAAVKATNDPITDIISIVNEAAGYGVKLRYMIMDYAKWLLFQQSTAVQNFCRTYIIDGTAYRSAPSLAVVNQVLAAQGLPTIIPINQRVTIENAVHAQTSTNPWYDTKYVTFLEDLKIGSMYFVKTAEEQAPVKNAEYFMKNNILVSKFRDTDPVSEVTVGLMNAIPAWPSINRAWILNTESHTAY